MIKELVEHIVKQLVDKPDLVRINVQAEDGKETFEINVDISDRGKVIGRQGQTIKAIRALVAAVTPQDKKITVDIA
jgi:uncharacterized protein